ncbi:hypothetical protein ACVMB3_003348 [Sinorhizobium meliloti]
MLIFFFKYHFTKLLTKLQRATLPGNGCDGCEMLLSDGSDGNLDPSLVRSASAPAAR